MLPKRLIYRLIIFLILASSTSVVKANWYWQHSSRASNLFIRTNGIANDGWYYTRYKLCYHTGYCSCVWHYRRYSLISAYGTYGAYSPSWRTALLGLVKERDRYAHAIATKALDHNEFLESIQALGIQSPAGYGANYAAAAYQQLGTTTYGTGQGAASTYAPQVGQVDVNAALEQLGRILEQAQAGVTKHTTELSGIVQGQSANSVQVAKIQALSDLMKVLNTTKADNTTYTFSLKKGSDGRWQTQTNSQNSSPYMAEATDIINKTCIKCHDATSDNGDLTDFNSWSQQEKAKRRGKIIARIVNVDPNKRMPLEKKGVPGKPLSAHQIETLIMALSN